MTPANPTIAAGATQQFTATGTYSDSSTKVLTSGVTWASANTAVATIDNTGLATAKNVLEIGSFCGRSTLWLARTAEHVTAVDTFDCRGIEGVGPEQRVVEFGLELP